MCHAGGSFFYFENTGTATVPVFAARTGDANPFDGINVGKEAAPTFADLDDDCDLDLVVGNEYGKLFYFVNTWTPAGPKFEERTGTANPFVDIDVEEWSMPTFGDLDADGTSRQRPP